MLSFIGDYVCKLDAKGRLVVPVAFRKEMQGEEGCSFVLRRSIFDECIDVYPKREWERLVGDLRSKVSRFNGEHARFMRAFFQGVVEVEVDGNGRILVPRKMLDEAGIGAEAVMVGLDAKIELWERGRYEKNAMSKDEFLRLTQKLGL